jgi:hypothetical protein
MEATIVEWKGNFTKLKRDHIAAAKAHNEATQKFIIEIKQIKKDHGAIMAKQGRIRQSDAAKYQKLRRDFDSALVDHGKKEQITIYKYEESKKEYERKILACQQKIKEFEKLLSASKKKSLKEKVDSVESESRKRVNQLQAELVETSNRLKAEADQQYLKGKAVSTDKLDRLLEANQKLKEQAMRQEREIEKSRECQVNAKASYHNLAASYQSSLFKIKTLLQQKENFSTQEITESEGKTVFGGREDFKKATGGSVTESTTQPEKKEKDSPENSPKHSSQPQYLKNRCEKSSEAECFLELESGKKIEDNASQHSPMIEMAPSPSSSDLGFERDYNLIVTKLGVESSQVESDLEASSVVSSIGSSLAGSAIFDAIYKRVEEHAQKMEVSQERVVSQSQETKANTFQVTHIYDILHHFVQLCEVNSSVRGLPRFQKLDEDSKNSEQPTTNLNEVGYTNKKISDLLVHKKRFESVQSSLMRQIIMTQLDELYPSTLIELFPSEYDGSRHSVSPSDLGFSTTDVDFSNETKEERICVDENSVGTNTTSDTARLEAARLQGEILSKQLHRSTEEIKMKTCEKDMRVLDLKYQNLRQEFEQMKLGKMPIPPTNIAFLLQNENDDGASHQHSLTMSSVTSAPTGLNEIDCLRKKVLNAELKVKYSKRKWEQHKSHVNVALKEEEVIVGNLKTVMSPLTDVEDQDESNNKLNRENNNLPTNISWGLEATLSTPDEEMDADPCNEKSSFDDSHSSPPYRRSDSEDCMSNEESGLISTASVEAQDGKPAFVDSGTKETATETDYPTTVYDSNDDGSNTNNSIDENFSTSIEGNLSEITDAEPNKSIEVIQLELHQAKEAAEVARQKQFEREQNLRDVIFQYKELEKQHNEALAEKNDSGTFRKLKKRGKGIQTLERELKQAQANVSVMKAELEVACEQHSDEKEHLREVMGQFQNLQVDFLKILAEKQELEKVVLERPGLASGVVPGANNIIGPQPRFLNSSGSWISNTGVIPAANKTIGPQPRYLNSSGPWVANTGVVSAVNKSMGSQPRYLNSSGSWVANTVGGVPVGGKPVVSARPRSQRPTPDGSPLRQVGGPPQRPKCNQLPTNVSNTQNLNSCKIVQLCNHDRLTPTRPIPPPNNTNAAMTSKLALTIHPTPNSTPSLRPPINSKMVMVVKGARQPQRQQQQQQQQQPLTIEQQQEHSSQLQQQVEPYESQAPTTATKPVGKKKKGIFRGWRKQSQSLKGVELVVKI